MSCFCHMFRSGVKNVPMPRERLHRLNSLHSSSIRECFHTTTAAKKTIRHRVIMVFLIFAEGFVVVVACALNLCFTTALFLRIICFFVFPAFFTLFVRDVLESLPVYALRHLNFFVCFAHTVTRSFLQPESPFCSASCVWTFAPHRHFGTDSFQCIF